MQINRISDGAAVFVNDEGTFLGDQVTVSPDGKLFAYSSNQKAYIYTYQGDNLVKVADLTPVYKGYDKNVISHVTFSPDGKKFAASTGEGNISVWRTRDWSLISNIKVTREYADDIAFSNDGKRVVAIYYDGVIMVLNIATRLSEGAINDFSEFIADVDETYMSPDGNYIAAVVWQGVDEGEYLEFWDVRTGTLVDASNISIKEFRTDVKDMMPKRSKLEEIVKPYLWSIAISPDKNLIATGTSSEVIKLWNYNDLSLAQEISQHSEGVSDLAFSSDGTMLASVMQDDPTINIWQIPGAQNIASFVAETDNSNSEIAFSPDGDLLAVGNQNGEIHFWSVKDKQHIHTIESPQVGRVRSLNFSPNGDYLVVTNQSHDKVIWLLGVRR